MKFIEWFKGLFKKAKPEKRIRREVTDKEREKILKLSDKGLSHDTIAGRLSRGQATISRVVKKEKERLQNERRAKKRSY